MSIRVWAYLDTLAEERAETQAAIDSVLDSGFLILGEHVKRFEAEFARYCGVEHGVGVNSGTDALFLALKALDLGPGDEVVTVSNTAVPTVSAIAATGATPRFVDIDPGSYLMDEGQLEDALTDRTRCILPVHLFGQCVDMDAVDRVAAPREIAVLEDCAQAHGARFRGRRAGCLGRLAAFSFYPTKILGGYGDGGMVVTADEELARRLRRLRFYGMEDQYYSEEQGYNSRLDELHAAILNKKLGHLQEYIERRQAIAARYDEALADSGLGLPRVAPGNEHVYYLYVVRHPARDRILELLREQEIFLNISYPWPIHTMRGYAHLGYREGDLPHTELAAREIFSLPMYPSLASEDQERVIESLRAVLKRV